MTDGVLWHRIQFTLTITYHYLFPQLTMGLALLIVVFKAARGPDVGDVRLRADGVAERAQHLGVGLELCPERLLLHDVLFDQALKIHSSPPRSKSAT
jgi:hypothetical protein